MGLCSEWVGGRRRCWARLVQRVRPQEPLRDAILGDLFVTTLGWGAHRQWLLLLLEVLEKRGVVWYGVV